MLFHTPVEEPLHQQGVQSRTKAAVPVDGTPEVQPRLRPGGGIMRYVVQSFPQVSVCTGSSRVLYTKYKLAEPLTIVLTLSYTPAWNEYWPPERFIETI